MNRLIYTTLLLFLLAGCMSQPARISQYNLPGYDEPAVFDTEGGTDATIVQVNLQVAGYLSAPGIVYQTSELEVESAYGHRWAEALPEQLHRILLTALARSDKNYRVVDRLADAGGEGLRLNIRVDRFQGRYDGKSVISGNWTLKSHTGEFIRGQRFNIETPLEQDGYPALVRSLNRGWKQVSEQIAGSLEG